MLRTLTVTLSMALAAVAVPALPALAQDGPLKIEITDGVTEPMAIAIPAFHGDAEVAQRVRDVVAADLTGTGIQDTAIATLALARAAKAGAGQTFTP